MVERVAASPDVGLVLSGGGSRVSFQVGALRYLYDVEGISPGVMAGTSAGAVVATVLAQGGHRSGQREQLDRVERLVRGMRDQADVVADTEWLAALRRIAPEWKGVVEQRRRLTRELMSQSAAGNAPVPQLVERLGELSLWASTRTVETVQALRALGRTGYELDRVLASAERAQGLFVPGPLARRLEDPEVFLPSRLEGSGIRLRVAVVGLESGDLRYVTETGRVVDRDDVPVPGLDRVRLVDAVRASCAIPVVLPPVLLAGEHYVDGGVRETLPVEVVTRHLGVPRCYAITASAVGGRVETDFSDRNMLDIGLRTVAGLMGDELLRDEIELARATPGVVLIDPELDVHEPLEVAPGLTAIAMDYGYLRAGDVVRRAGPQELRRTRQIIELRRRIWALEAAQRGRAQAADDVAAQLRASRHELRRAVDAKPPDDLPEGADRWWRPAETAAAAAPSH